LDFQYFRKAAISMGYMQKEILMKNKSHQTMGAVAIDEFGGIEEDEAAGTAGTGGGDR
jgi:hypothetical protein